MGWKGAIRTVAATARRMEKDANRRQKIIAKELMAQDAALGVLDWELSVQKLTTVHHQLANFIDWTALLNKPQPSNQIPISKTTHQDRARFELDRFKPTLFDKLKGRAESKKQVLVDEYDKALGRDRSNHLLTLEEHKNTVLEWETDRALADRLLAGEDSAIKEVITEYQSLSKTDLIGSYISFSIENNLVHATPQVHSTDIVPNFRRKQLASGKLSQTDMPQSQFNALYQDYVASVALKVAGDLFKFLPLEEIFVTCESKMLNTATGRQEFTPILSVQFVRDTYQTLNLSTIDPSDSLANFNHVMNFKKTKGFSPIVPLG